MWSLGVFSPPLTKLSVGSAWSEPHRNAGLVCLALLNTIRNKEEEFLAA